MLINLRNALMSGKRLPYDAEVEYLQSSGTQYVNTGIVPDVQDVRIEITYSKGRGHLFGSRVSSSFTTNQFWSAYAAGIDVCRCDWVGSNTNISVDSGAKTIVFASNTTGSSITYNGAATTGGVKVTNNLSMVIFGVNTNGTITAATQMTLYSFKIWKNGVLVRDLIPVRKGTVGYLYDRVSGEMDPFGNAGTGDFVLGPDVVPMTWQDGLQYNNVGTPVESATSSVGLDYIPITAGHSFTWRLGYGSSASADLIIYNANKERIDYWVARDRTVTISGAAAYMRISALTSYKEQATVYDETAQKYVFANGRIPIPA